MENIQCIRKQNKNSIGGYMMSQVKGFFKGVSAELKKIAWPTEKEMKTYTLQVLIFVVVLSIFFFAVDLVISQVMSLLG